MTDPLRFGEKVDALQHDLVALRDLLIASSGEEREQIFFFGFVNLRLDIMCLAEKYIDLASLNRRNLMVHTEYAYTEGATDLVPYCIEKLDMRQREGEKSLLRMAVLHCSYDIVRLLLDYGEDPNHHYMSEFTPFYQSIASDNVRMFDLLFMYGGNINEIYDGETFAVRAFRMGHRHVAARIFELGLVELHRITPSFEPKFIYTLLLVNCYVNRKDDNDQGKCKEERKKRDSFLVQYTTIHPSKELRKALVTMYNRGAPSLVEEQPLAEETIHHLSEDSE